MHKDMLHFFCQLSDSHVKCDDIDGESVQSVIEFLSDGAMVFMQLMAFDEKPNLQHIVCF